MGWDQSVFFKLSLTAVVFIGDVLMVVWSCAALFS